jgi:hypothetical protein
MLFQTNRNWEYTEADHYKTRREEGEWWIGWLQLRYILNTYINTTVHPPVQLLYANKIIKNKMDHLEKKDWKINNFSMSYRIKQ